MIQAETGNLNDAKFVLRGRTVSKAENEVEIDLRAIKTALRSRAEAMEFISPIASKLGCLIQNARQQAKVREDARSKALKQTEYQRATKQPSWRGKEHP